MSCLLDPGSFSLLEENLGRLLGESEGAGPSRTTCGRWLPASQGGLLRDLNLGPASAQPVNGAEKLGHWGGKVCHPAGSHQL